MQNAEIDIIVHSGNSTFNNSYKTKNALLNAWILKAFPILSNQPPYEDVEDLGLGLLCEKNTNLWHDNLVKALSDTALVSQVRENLHQYVVGNYSGEKNLEVLKIISKNCHPPGASVIENRSRMYLDLVKKDMPIVTTSNPLKAHSAIRLVHKLEYKIIPQAQQWAGFEFMIGTYQKVIRCQLEITVIDLSARTIIRHYTLEMEEASDDQIVKIIFDAIPDSKDKEYIVRFTYKETQDISPVAIYETNKSETKIKRTLRRLRLLSRGNILACRLLYREH